MSRPFSHERMLELARELFREHGSNLSLRQFARACRVSQTTILNHVGTWLEFKKHCGYPPVAAPRGRFAPDCTPEVLIRRLKELAAKYGDRITIATFHRHTGISTNVIYSRFPSWTEFRARAGLTPHNRSSKRLSTQALLADMCRVYITTRETMTRRRYQRHGYVSIRTLRERFGSWRKAVDAYLDYIDKLVRLYPNPDDRLAHATTLAQTLRRPQPDK